MTDEVRSECGQTIVTPEDFYLSITADMYKFVIYIMKGPIICGTIKQYCASYYIHLIEIQLIRITVKGLA